MVGAGHVTGELDLCPRHRAWNWVSHSPFPGKIGPRSQIRVWQDKSLLSPNLEGSPVINLLSWEGSEVLGAGGGGREGKGVWFAKRGGPARSQVASRPGGLRPERVRLASGQLHPGAGQGCGPLCGHGFLSLSPRLLSPAPDSAFPSDLSSALRWGQTPSLVRERELPALVAA